MLALLLADSLPTFVDVTREAGLAAFVNTQGARTKDFVIESVGGGCAFLDYDNDGKLDILLVRGSTLEKLRKGSGDSVAALYRNEGHNRFRDVTVESGLIGLGWGMGVAAADVDANGWTDVYVTGFGRNFLFLNEKGKFREAAEKAGLIGGGFSTGAAFFDYDRDGRLDLYVARYIEFDIHRPPRRNPACWYKGLDVFCGPRGLKGAADSLYRNEGGGRFRDVSAKAGLVDSKWLYYGLGVVAADLDNDGWTDLFVGNDSTPNFLYHNNRDGTFTESAVFAGVAYNDDGYEQASMGVDAGDINSDGLLDIVVTNFEHDADELYQNLDRLEFRSVTMASGFGPPSYLLLGWGVGILDFNNDGLADIFVANGHVYPEVDGAGLGTSYAQKHLLYYNRGGGKFTESGARSGAALEHSYTGRGTAFGDYDDDGDIDVLINNIDAPPTLLRNDGGHRGGWIRFTGAPVGTRITVWTGGRVQVQEVRSAASYLSANDPRLLFGLASAIEAERVVVRLPSGETRELGRRAGGRSWDVR
ncbi:MAG: CRTAC1 family protein [Bryobacteraceae bacterium]